jgi:methylmalonyl-CoA carboxyltransferase large subunit
MPPPIRSQESGIRSQESAELEGLRGEVARLAERIAALESLVRGAKPAPGPLTPDSCPLAPEAGLSEELLLVISAAIAAFLGKKPHIRQIRLLGAASWAQHGRATIQASHDLAVRHG